MHTNKAIAERFRYLHFHDDTFVGMNILPTQVRRDTAKSTIEIHLSNPDNKPGRVLRFSGCANLRVVLDFDVLAHNLPPNTSKGDAHAKHGLMREFMESQKRDWGIGYSSMSSPLDLKVQKMEEFVCFRVQFFGGVVEIIAREFLIEDIAT